MKYMLFVSGALVLCSSVFILSTLKLKNIPSYLLGLYLVSVAQIVLIFEMAGLFHLINNRGFVLVANVVVLFASLGLWFIRRKPAIFAVFRDREHRDLLNVSRLIQAMRDNGAVVFFGACVLAAFAYAAWLIIFFPQNVDDVLTTNLARVGFWLQQGSFQVWNTSAYDLPQVTSPANAQILILWTVLFNGTDLFAAFTQWTAALAGMLAIYGLCRLLGQSRPLAAFIALLYPTIPAVTLQLSTAQTDLLACTFFISSIFLLWLGWKDDNTHLLLLSALSYALGLGTKQTLIFAIPGLAILLLILFIKLPANRLKKIGTWAAGTAVLFLLLGSFFYIQNILVFGQVFGPDEVAQAYTGQQEISTSGQLVMGVKNFVSFSLNSLFSEFFDDKISPILGDVFPALGKFADYRGSVLPSGVGTVGPLISILTLIGIIAVLRKPKQQRDPLALAMLICGVVYFVVIMVVRKYSNAIYRYSILSYTLFLPLVGQADFWFRDLDRKTINRSFIRLVSVFSILVMAWVVTGDGSKSIYDMINEPDRSRVTKQLAFMKREQPELEPSFAAVDSQVSADASIGLVGTGKYPTALLFGKNFSRKVTLIVPSETLTINMPDYPTVDYLLVDSSLITQGFTIPEGYSTVSEDGLLHLYSQANK